MSSKTKIMVFHMKEVIYTGIFILLGILFLILLLFMFLPGKDEETPTDTEAMAKYIPGIYTSSITLNDMAFDLEVIVDSNRIKSMQLNNLSTEVTTMYPLIQPTFEALSEQILVSQTLEDYTYDPDTKYTSLTLMNAIENALAKATVITQSE
ncbi:MAG: hypothetical protein IJX86_08625 [Lachnospiraceae bacterium]|nr:hypothetical protein [Lachnospiraceae bacterium]MBR3683940.1 hypothetical protein [Lachnospiraceae bacterium]